VIKDLNFSKYKRFFAFGCSFTRYWWPTWADLIAQEIAESYNYGKCGAGNHYIFSNVVYANQKFQFNKDDLVIVMWTNALREDRYIENSWITPGNIYTQGFYDECFLQYVDERGFLIRDLGYISAVNAILKNSGCDYDNLSMVSIQNLENYKTNIKGDQDIIDTFANLLSQFKPSINEIMYNYDWEKPINGIRPVQTFFGFQKKLNIDYHPPTQTHFDYLNKVYGQLNWSNKTLDYLQYINKILTTEVVRDTVGCVSCPTVASKPLLGNT
jgi:hypothetical protein